jgi:signal transduction histidine kinase
MWLLGITAGVLLVVLAWVVVLGRRLRKQMAIIRQKLRSGAVLQERNRIARELHDTLEQELAGITMQLDLASDCFREAPRVAQQALETARSMSRQSMVEARRSVCDLRCDLLENGDLISAIKHEVNALGSRDHVKIDFQVTGVPVRLSGPIEMNLLRIAQEAVANALKHGHAQKVDVNLKYDTTKVRLSVSDDGNGFLQNDGPLAGHFGLLDMKERAQSLGSRLMVDSEPGRGTRIAVETQLHANDFLVLDYMKLIPGVVSTYDGSASGTGGINTFNINGTRANQHEFTIDGSSNVDTGDNGNTHVTINTDAIAEVKVLTSNYQAEFGKAGGGQVAVTTRSGSNQFH